MGRKKLATSSAAMKRLVKKTRALPVKAAPVLYLYLSSSVLSFSFARQSVRNFGTGAPSLAAFSVILPNSVTIYQIATSGKNAVLYVNGSSNPNPP